MSETVRDPRRPHGTRPFTAMNCGTGHSSVSGNGAVRKAQQHWEALVPATASKNVYVRSRVATGISR